MPKRQEITLSVPARVAHATQKFEIKANARKGFLRKPKEENTSPKRVEMRKITKQKKPSSNPAKATEKTEHDEKKSEISLPVAKPAPMTVPTNAQLRAIDFFISISY